LTGGFNVLKSPLVQQYALVSNRILRDGAPVGWIYREHAELDDSGWRVYSGDEDQQYADDASNFDLVPLQDLLRVDPTLKRIISAPVGAAYERRRGETGFRQVREVTPQPETRLKRDVIATRNIANGWSIDLHESFSYAVDAEGDRIFTRRQKRVRAAVFSTQGCSAEEAIERIFDGQQAHPAQTFERKTPQLVGRAFLYRARPTGKRCWELLSATALRGALLTVVFEFGDVEEVNWAIQAWQSVGYHNPGPQ
jgi:hypothetical protein